MENAIKLIEKLAQAEELPFNKFERKILEIRGGVNTPEKYRDFVLALEDRMIDTESADCEAVYRYYYKNVLEWMEIPKVEENDEEEEDNWNVYSIEFREKFHQLYNEARGEQ